MHGPLLERAWDNSSTLRIVDWTNTGGQSGAGDTQLAELIKTLPRNTHITEIRLSNNLDITDAHMDQLAALVGKDGERQGGIFKGLCQITSVALDGTSVSAAKAAHVAQQIELRRANLEVSKVRSNDSSIVRVDWSPRNRYHEGVTDAEIGLLTVFGGWGFDVKKDQGDIMSVYTLMNQKCVMDRLPKN